MAQDVAQDLAQDVTQDVAEEVLGAGRRERREREGIYRGTRYLPAAEPKPNKRMPPTLVSAPLNVVAQ